MARDPALLLAALLLAALAAPGLGLPAKEKRGWTLNSAGYLLGPHAVDSHSSFGDKHSLAGKRELLLPEAVARPGGPGRPRPRSSAARTILELLSLLSPRGAGALEGLPGGRGAVASEDAAQA